MGHGSNSGRAGAFFTGGGAEREISGRGNSAEESEKLMECTFTVTPRFGLGLRRQDGLATTD